VLHIHDPLLPWPITLAVIMTGARMSLRRSAVRRSTVLVGRCSGFEAESAGAEGCAVDGDIAHTISVALFATNVRS
jgi:hypothetical protein